MVMTGGDKEVTPLEKWSNNIESSGLYDPWSRILLPSWTAYHL